MTKLIKVSEQKKLVSDVDSLSIYVYDYLVARIEYSSDMWKLGIELYENNTNLALALTGVEYENRSKNVGYKNTMRWLQKLAINKGIMKRSDKSPRAHDLIATLLDTVDGNTILIQETIDKQVAPLMVVISANIKISKIVEYRTLRGLFKTDEDVRRFLPVALNDNFAGVQMVAQFGHKGAYPRIDDIYTPVKIDFS